MALIQIVTSMLGSAQTVDQYRQLFTGIMADQPITFLPGVSLKQISGSPAAPTAAVAAGGSVDIGAHTYAVTFLTADGGETLAGTTVAATTTSGNQTVNLSAIPTGPTGVTQRNIYRSKVGTTSPLYLLHTIADNTSTTYTDAAADSTLPTTQPPTHGSVGGSLKVLDTNGNVKARIFNDGAVSFDAGAITSDGNGNLTVSSIQTSGGGLLTVSGLQSVQSGAASGLSFKAWTGTAGVVPFSVGAQYNGALTFIDQYGSFNFASGATGKIVAAQSGAANGLTFVTWDGTASHTPFSIGGQLNGAPTFIDNSGNLTVRGTGTLGSGQRSAGQGINGVSSVDGVVNNTGLAVVQGSSLAALGMNVYYDGTTDRAMANGQSAYLRLHTDGSLNLWEAAGTAGATVPWATKFTVNPDGSLVLGGSYIKSGTTFLGFKDSSNNKIGEMKSGSFTIGGHQVYNGDGTGTTTWSAGSFDSFDIAELYPVAEEYPSGTVVCQGSDGRMHRCTHDGCPRVTVISHRPALEIGFLPDEGETRGDTAQQYAALAGRVLCATREEVAPLAFVCSDGCGGVRPFRDGECGLALGYALVGSRDGRVGIFLRPMRHQS